MLPLVVTADVQQKSAEQMIESRGRGPVYVFLCAGSIWLRSFICFATQ